jgi:ERCC4-type nuclease
MVIIDDRAGSIELLDCPVLKDIAILGHLDFGDVMLTGHGPDNSTITVGIELKKIPDLVSSISTGRLGGHQLPGMARSYDYIWLLTYGQYRISKTNLLQTKRKTSWKTFKWGVKEVPWAYFEGTLLTYDFIGGMRHKHLSDINEAAAWITVMDRWLNKPWDKHKGLNVFDKSRESAAIPNMNPVEEQMARVAAQLPAVGWERGWNAAKFFNSVEEMMNASHEEWRKVAGFGKVVADAVWQSIRRKK